MSAARDKPVILYLVTEDWYFWSHRLPIARAAQAAGWEVVIATRVESHGDMIGREGFRLVPIAMRRRSLASWREAAALAGMGYVFTSSGVKARALRPLIRMAFRWLLDRRNSRLILQNSDDVKVMTDGTVAGGRITLIRGSAVDTKAFTPPKGSAGELAGEPAGEPDGMPIAVMVSRKLWDKGVGELVERKLSEEAIVAQTLALYRSLAPGTG